MSESEPVTDIPLRVRVGGIMRRVTGLQVKRWAASGVRTTLACSDYSRPVLREPRRAGRKHLSEWRRARWRRLRTVGFHSQEVLNCPADDQFVLKDDSDSLVTSVLLPWYDYGLGGQLLFDLWAWSHVASIHLRRIVFVFEMGVNWIKNNRNSHFFD